MSQMSVKLPEKNNTLMMMGHSKTLNGISMYIFLSFGPFHIVGLSIMEEGNCLPCLLLLGLFFHNL